MKKQLALLVMLLVAVLLCLSAAALDVYVADGGTGDGLTKETPLGTMEAALDAAKDGGRITIVGTATLISLWSSPHTQTRSPRRAALWSSTSRPTAAGICPARPRLKT